MVTVSNPSSKPLLLCPSPPMQQTVWSASSTTPANSLADPVPPLNSSLLSVPPALSRGLLRYALRLQQIQHPQQTAKASRRLLRLQLSPAFGNPWKQPKPMGLPVMLRDLEILQAIWT